MASKIGYFLSRAAITAKAPLTAPPVHNFSFVKNIFNSPPSSSNKAVNVTLLSEKELKKLCDQNFTKKLEEASKQFQQIAQQQKPIPTLDKK